MLSFFPRGVLDEILNLIESISEVFLPALIKISHVLLYDIFRCLVSLIEISGKPISFFNLGRGGGSLDNVVSMPRRHDIAYTLSTSSVPLNVNRSSRQAIIQFKILANCVLVTKEPNMI